MIRLLLLGVGLAAAVWVGWQAWQNQQTAKPVAVVQAQAPKANPEPAPAPQLEAAKVTILSAARDVPAQTLLQAADLTWTEINMDQVVPGTVLQEGDPEVLQSILGLVSLGPLKAGDPISFAALQEPTQTLDLSGTLGNGNSAMAIAVSAETAAGGFVRPGDKVDVIFLPAVAANGSAAAPRLLASSVRVLAVDEITSPAGIANPSQISTITLELSRSKVIAVSQATLAGRVSVALRPRGDLAFPVMPEAKSDAIRIIRQSGIELMEPMK